MDRMRAMRAFRSGLEDVVRRSTGWRLTAHCVVGKRGFLCIKYPIGQIPDSMHIGMIIADVLCARGYQGQMQEILNHVGNSSVAHDRNGKNTIIFWREIITTPGGIIPD